MDIIYSHFCDKKCISEPETNGDDFRAVTNSIRDRPILGENRTDHDQFVSDGFVQNVRNGAKFSIGC